MNQYIITDEELETILQRRGAIYISCQGKFRDEIVAKVRSRTYQNQREKIPSILMCPELPNSKGFCTIPSKCIAKRMTDPDDCAHVCKAMQELRGEEK